jgi:hypothetical protein
MRPEIKRLSDAVERIKFMDAADKAGGFATPIQMGVPELLRVAFAAAESGIAEAIEEGLAYAYLAGIIHTQNLTNTNHDPAIIGPFN